MANYIVPQVQVFQEFQTVPAADVRELNAHISGGHAYLVRYTNPEEQILGLLGYYDPENAECFGWPNQPSLSVLDLDYAKLFIKDALLGYHVDPASGGYGTVQKTTGHSGRLTSSSVNYRSNGTAYPRHASLLDRDVQLGDTVRVHAVVGLDEFILWTYVADFVANVITAIVEAPVDDVDNQTSIAFGSVSFQQTLGGVNCVTITTANSTAYDGLEDGDVNEVYTIRVIGSSTGGDLTTARLRILSASGNDEQSSIAAAASNSPTSIGTRGLTVTFLADADSVCSASAALAGISDVDLVIGQEWEVTVAQAFTPAVATASGTYSGAADTTYIVEISRGGNYIDVVPRISVSADDGSDISGPTVVAGTGIAVPIGSKGATIRFNNSLNKGDKYYVHCVAAADGPVRTLVLGHNLDSSIPSGTDVDLSLYIRKSVQVSKNRDGYAPLTNWSADQVQICLESGIIAYDESWTNDGVPQPLPVTSEASQNYGVVYIEYRAWLADLVSQVLTIENTGDLDALISGPLSIDNPLKWGVFKALSNSNGTAVKFTGVADPNDVDSWLDVLQVIDGRFDVYGLVPLTYNKTVLDLFVAHVNGQSTEDIGRWRVLWLNLENPPVANIVDASTSLDGAAVMGILEDNPSVDGTQYTLLTVPSQNSRFVTNGVRVGDLVRYLYSGDGFGGLTYSEFIVASVINESQITLSTGHSSAINFPQKLEIHRNLTATEQAAQIALSAGSYSNRRVRAVWPDSIGSGNENMPGIYLCAALSGLTSGVVPHQGLTHLAISGFDDVSRTTRLFSRTQLNTMAGSGVWIVDQDAQSGAIFTRHAVTTARTDDINAREEIVTRNVDSISFLFLDAFSPYIGVSNVTPSMLDILEAETLARIQFLRSNNFVQRLGGQLIDATIADIHISPIFKDRIVISVDLVIPYALNVIELHLIV